MSIEQQFQAVDATDLARAVQKGEIASVDLVEAVIARAERVNPEINAIAERMFDSALAAARTVDRKLPFAGIPIAIKDLGISVEGVPLHSGSRLPPVVPLEDSTLIRRYRQAGLIPVMTSTSPEFGLRLVTESTAFGITRNPWNTDRVTGGSSGGSAALVSAGIVPVAHASDGGGSIRVPSACTNLIGMKPSRGRVPLTPDESEGWHGLVVQHAITRSVRDSARLLDLSSAGFDPLSPYQAPPPKKSFEAACNRNSKGMKIGVFARSPLSLAVSNETHEALDAAIKAAEHVGHHVTEIDLPMLDRDFMADFARLVSSGHAGEMRQQGERIGRSPIGDLEPTSRILARFGEVIGAAEVAAAQIRLYERSRALLATTNSFDAVLMPVIAHPPLKCGAMDASGMDLVIEQLLDMLHLTPLLKLKPFLGKLMDQSLWFTHWPPVQNVTGQPAIALPVHRTGDGLPLGIQAAGRVGEEETLYTLASQLEKYLEWDKRTSPLVE